MHRRLERFASPMFFWTRDFAPLGGLITYGSDLYDLGHREGLYIGRILSGANPGDLPVEQSSKFQLVVNLKTANARAGLLIDVACDVAQPR